MTTPPLLTTRDVGDAIEQGTLPGWAVPAFTRFRQSMTSSERPFPCTFGVEGFRHNGFRFVFAGAVDEASSLRLVRDSLRRYLAIARTIHRYTSLVVFFAPPAAAPALDDYRADFWMTLQYLRHHDPQPWPATIPTDPEHPRWEFCFDGQPVFVVCNTPSHVQRRSRHADVMTITFQPRWVFDELHAHPRKAERARTIIRARLERYDSVPVYQAMGIYGDPANREWKQYFLPDAETADSALESGARCPLHITPPGGS
jgi:FPC/CPF motif-containing protein YcgG